MRLDVLRHCLLQRSCQPFDTRRYNRSLAGDGGGRSVVRVLFLADTVRLRRCEHVIEQGLTPRDQHGLITFEKGRIGATELARIDLVRIRGGGGGGRTIRREVIRRGDRQIRMAIAVWRGDNRWSRATAIRSTRTGDIANNGLDRWCE